MAQVLLPLTYLGSIYFYSKLINSDRVIIEQFDSYHKQTYRNRCTILAANGPLNLSIPVMKNSGQKILVKDVQIDYVTRWQDIHWRSICSAYNSSPFFEYYADDLAPFYGRKYKFLLDFNIEIMEKVLELLSAKAKYELSSDYMKSDDGFVDLRDSISPKSSSYNEDPTFHCEHYTQTFDEKFGFVENLSIVDLLFNAGPEALPLLR